MSQWSSLLHELLYFLIAAEPTQHSSLKSRHFLLLWKDLWQKSIPDKLPTTTLKETSYPVYFVKCGGQTAWVSLWTRCAYSVSSPAPSSSSHLFAKKSFKSSPTSAHWQTKSLRANPSPTLLPIEMKNRLQEARHPTGGWETALIHFLTVYKFDRVCLIIPLTCA